MIRVRNRKFLHVNKIDSKNNKLLNVGEKIKFGDDFNPYRKSYEYGNVSLEDNVGSLIKAVTLYWHFTLETIFEEERIKINPELPSRLKCIWLTDKECLSYWYKQLSQADVKLQTVELDVTGKILKCDAHWVELQPSPLELVRENAQQYWNGVIKCEYKIEYLFEGNIEVSSILQ
ncbi:DUF2441 domain-containing protein [Lysinibacillus sp. HST-98]|uniref:DUF2441 domain-containing protein n=1 Tax=Lysinibacillus sp. HST-98 TaxID=2800419 RepID=UPI0019263F89|nr:DUF2441 domain-containing protein [Lysinibacillus sp. HST-98]